MSVHTGKRGPAPKPAEERIRRNKPKPMEVRNNLPGAGIIAINVPEPDDEWADQVADEWYDYWNSPIASVLNRDSDVSALRRLFDYKHELVWAMAAYRSARITLGSMGQDRVNPMADMVMKLEKLIIPLEDRFGMSPAGRIRLGASAVETARTLNDINAQIDKEVMGELDDEDPRLILEAFSPDKRAEGL